MSELSFLRSCAKRHTPLFASRFFLFRPSEERFLVDLVYASKAKAALVRPIAERCLVGEFDGSAFKAAQDPECVQLGVIRSNIQYHMARLDPASAAARAADRARVATQTAAAEAIGVPVKIIFVERAGSAPAAAAIEAAMGVIDSQIGVQVRRVAKRAREEAATPLQAEIEAEAERRGALEAELDELRLSNAAQRRKVEAGERQIAALEAKLARTSSSAAASAAKAEATVEVAKGAATAARGETKAYIIL